MMLAALYPELFHVSAAGAWPGIAEHGLLSARRLTALFQVRQGERAHLEDRRAAPITLEHGGIGRAVLRDQRPLSLKKLASCLEDGMTVDEWMTMLNDYVFFWPTRARTQRLLRTYSHESHDVLVVDTAAFLDRYSSVVRLSHMNTGTTSPMAHPRGRSTFRRLPEYPLEERRRRYGKAAAVGEVVVPDAVLDVAELTLRVERWNGEQLQRICWERTSPPS